MAGRAMASLNILVICKALSMSCHTDNLIVYVNSPSIFAMQCE